MDVTALVAGLGVGGVAVALAVQSVLGDVFASLSIVLDRPFEVGDFIIVDDLMGTVEQVEVAQLYGVRRLATLQLAGDQAAPLCARPSVALRGVVPPVGVHSRPRSDRVGGERTT